MTDIRDSIRDYIVREFKPQEPLAFDSPLIQQGIIDSLAVLMLIGFIGERFGVVVDPEDVRVENFETINAIQELVDTVQRAQPPPAGRNQDAV